MLGGPVKFVLSTSGHIASMVNPPSSKKAAFRIASATRNPADPAQCLAEAAGVSGRWWPDYSSWLAEHGGGQTDSPPELGARDYPPICLAPGTYVHDH